MRAIFAWDGYSGRTRLIRLPSSIFDVRNVRTLSVGGVGITTLVPPIKGNAGPSFDPTAIPSIPSRGSLNGDDEESGPLLMIGGTRDGCIIAPGRRFEIICAALWVRESCRGSALRRPRITGVETVLAKGKPTVFHKGNNSRHPITSTCTPNDVKVVQLRRARCAHEVSSMLSARNFCSMFLSKISSAAMVSSSFSFACCYGHHCRTPGRHCRK